MKETKILIKNSSLLFFSQFLSRLFGFIFITFFARKFGAQTLGNYGLITTFFMYFVTFVEFGLNPLLIREIAKDKTKINHYFFNVLAIRTAFALLSFILILPLIFVLGYSTEFRALIMIYFISILFQPVLSTISSVFWGLNKYEYPTITLVITSFIGTIINFIVLFSGGGLKQIIIVSIPINLVPIAILSFYLVKEKIKIKLQVDIKTILQIIRKGTVFFLIAIFFIIYIRTDLVILSKISSKENVGLYNAAFRIFMVFLVFINIVSHAAFPTMSRLYKENYQKFKHLFYSLIRFYMFTAFPIVITFSLFSKQILHMVFGSDFIRASNAMIPLSWTFLIMALNTPIALALNTTRFEKVSMYTAIIGAILNIGLDFILIPKFAILGAGIATIIPRIVNSIIISSVFMKYFFKIDVRKFWKIIAVNIVFGIILYYFRNYQFLIVLSVYFTIYLTSIFLFRIIDKNEIGLLMDIIKNWRGYLKKNKAAI